MTALDFQDPKLRSQVGSEEHQKARNIFLQRHASVYSMVLDNRIELPGLNQFLGFQQEARDLEAVSTDEEQLKIYQLKFKLKLLVEEALKADEPERKPNLKAHAALAAEKPFFLKLHHNDEELFQRLFIRLYTPYGTILSELLREISESENPNQSIAWTSRSGTYRKVGPELFKRLTDPFSTRRWFRSMNRI